MKGTDKIFWEVKNLVCVSLLSPLFLFGLSSIEGWELNLPYYRIDF